MSRAVEEVEAKTNELYEQAYGNAEDEQTIETGTASEEQVQDTEAEGAQQVQTKQGDEFQHKYETLQGMYNSDVQKLQQQVSFLQGMLAEQPPAQQTAQQVPPVDKSLEYLETEYPYVVEGVYSIIRQELAKERQWIMSEVSKALDNVLSRVNDVGMAAGRSQSSLFWSSLSELVEDWEVWNTNKDFLAWLDEEDPLSGYKRFDLLRQAKASYNADKVAAFFREFKRYKGISESAGNVQTNQQVSKSERMVAPGRSAGSVSQTTKKGGEEPLTRDDIAQFYRDVQRGAYVGRDQDKAAMEARIAKMASDSSKRRG